MANSAFEIHFPTNNCRIKTGTYTGDGTVSQDITGIGFQPKFVWIDKHVVDGGSTSYSYFLNDQFTAGYSKYAGAQTPQANQIIAIIPDGFTVDDAGGDAHPNANTVAYDYIALG